MFCCGSLLPFARTFLSELYAVSILTFQGQGVFVLPLSISLVYSSILSSLAGGGVHAALRYWVVAAIS